MLHFAALKDGKATFESLKLSNQLRDQSARLYKTAMGNLVPIIIPSLDRVVVRIARPKQDSYQVHERQSVYIQNIARRYPTCVFQAIVDDRLGTLFERVLKSRKYKNVEGALHYELLEFRFVAFGSRLFGSCLGKGFVRDYVAREYVVDIEHYAMLLISCSINPESNGTPLSRSPRPYNVQRGSLGEPMSARICATPLTKTSRRPLAPITHNPKGTSSIVPFVPSMTSFSNRGGGTLNCFISSSCRGWTSMRLT